MRRMIGFLLGVLLLGVARSMRTGAWCLRGSAASGGHRTAALVGMGLGLARPVALMVGEEENPACPGYAGDSVRGTIVRPSTRRRWWATVSPAAEPRRRECAVTPRRPTVGRESEVAPCTR